MEAADLQRAFIYLFAFGSIALFVWWVHATYARLAAHAHLTDERRRAISSALLAVITPFASLTGHWIGRRIDRIEAKCQTTGHTSFLVAIRRRAGSMLIGAGLPHGMTPNEFMGLWTVSSALGLLIGVGSFFMLRYRWAATPTAIIVPFLIIGAIVPWVWLRDCEKKRKTSIRNGLPYALDLLTLAVEAGLDFTAALARIIRRQPNAALSQELGETLRQVQMGVPRAEALRALSNRVVMEEIFTVTSALIQADELGASLGPILRIQADQFRVRRAQAAEKAAMETPVKLLFPLICFFFPATFIMIFGPVLLKFFGSR
jgi:tight adherence protein C